MLARPGLPSFDYVRASTPAEVVQLLGEHGPAARLMMGGTDLLIRMREGSVRPRVVVDVKHLPGMKEIRFDESRGLTVGAAVTMNQLAGDADVRAHYPLLAEAARSVASYQLRNRATLGGNLCNASPCADTAPAALVLDGRVVLCGPKKEREVRALDFFAGPGKTTMRPGEFMTTVRFPLLPAGNAGRYLKLGRSRIGDLSLVGVAIFGFPSRMAPSGYDFRIGLGSVAAVPLLAREAEAVLATNPPGEDAFALAAERAMESATPIDDVRAGAEYQKAMVRTLTLRGLREVWGQLCRVQGGEDG